MGGQGHELIFSSGLFAVPRNPALYREGIEQCGVPGPEGVTLRFRPKLLEAGLGAQGLLCPAKLYVELGALQLFCGGPSRAGVWTPRLRAGAFMSKDDLTWPLGSPLKGTGVPEGWILTLVGGGATLGVPSVIASGTEAFDLRTRWHSGP